MDGVDAALVDLSSVPRVISALSCPFSTQIRERLGSISAAHTSSIDTLGELDRLVGELFAAAANQLIKQAKIDKNRIRAIGSHGQTIRHRPENNFPYSLQIGDPNTIAELTGITTVADFRRRDIASGGQGAPLVPGFHAATFRTAEENRVVLNIGGIANITVLAADSTRPVTGFDTGPGNTLVDGWIHKHQGKPYDDSGAWAATGNIDQALLTSLFHDAYFDREPPKSTGREYFNVAWIERHLSGTVPPAKNIQATLCELTALSVAEAIQQHAPGTTTVLVCGGGSRNDALMNRLRSRLGDITVSSTEAYGIAPQWVEAAAFAWLAKQTLEGRPGNVPSVTGASRPVVLGGIYHA
ncbi:MAG: anhydro-N-acetylmuramic acid kinase [Gammaproteobacteria bacterium]|nr:MAG: anhydro-N-acetylmuramic acid kinase [Gammaproteobacteria bacterium]TND06195.1 MAG: anhydro-N-acetylmuramic acid kinase [Gammaproteobacteria bacterium]